METRTADIRDFNVQPDAIREFSKEEILAVFRNMARLRKFEHTIIECNDKSRETFKNKVIHMVTGQEVTGSVLAEMFPDYHFFAGHRCADLYLGLGASTHELRDEIMYLDSGCMNGTQGAQFAYHKDGITIHTNTGFIGEQLPLAVGYSLASGQKTIAICGDGAAEEDYALQAYGFAATHKLPILFVVNDNNLSVLSPKENRRSWNIAKLAESFGLASADIADDPWTLMKVLSDMKNRLPALVNVRVNRNYWHIGFGIDNPPLWDRYAMVKRQISEIGYEHEMLEIEWNAENEMHELWREYL